MQNSNEKRKPLINTKKARDFRENYPLDRFGPSADDFTPYCAPSGRTTLNKTVPKYNLSGEHEKIHVGRTTGNSMRAAIFYDGR